MVTQDPEDGGSVYLRNLATTVDIHTEYLRA
jgi:hypothetical protein